MFGNLFGKQSKVILDSEGWRRKRHRDEIEEVLDSSDEEGGEQLEEREQRRTEEGGRRGKGRMRLNEETTTSNWRTTTSTTEECDVGLQYMQQGGGGGGGGGGKEGEEEEGEEDGMGGMLGMMTAMQEEPRGGLEEEEEEEEEGEEEEGEEEEVTEGALLNTLLEAVAAAKRARDGAGSMEEEEEESQDMLARPTQYTRSSGISSSSSSNPFIEHLVRGFRGILSSSSSSSSSSPLPPLQDLLDALTTTHKDRLKDSAKQIAHELKKIQNSLHIRLPYQPGALLRASRQQQREQQQQQEGEGGGGEGGGGGGAKKPDEAFEQQMWACNHLIDQLLALEEAGERLGGYGKEYLERNMGALEEKDAWIKTWQVKLQEQSGEVERTRGELRGMDGEFDQLAQRSFAEEGGNANGLSSIPSLPTSSSIPSSLALVSTLLDICRSPHYVDLVSVRQHKAEELESKARKRQRVATNLRLVEAFIGLMRVLVEKGRQKLTTHTKKVEQEITQIRTRLHEELRGEVVAAALRLQHVLEFHEARKERAGKSAKLREHELRQHTSLFGQDTPTETLRLEACVKELRRVVAHSTLAIERAMQRNQVFWARVEEALPEPVARSLGSLFQQHMTNPNSSSSNGKGRPLYSAYPAPLSASAAAAVAAANGGGGGGNPPEAPMPLLLLQGGGGGGRGGGREGGKEGGSSALAQVVAEGAAASQQEEEERAKAMRGGEGMEEEEEEEEEERGGEEGAVMGVRVGGGGRRSPEGDGCVVM